MATLIQEEFEICHRVISRVVGQAWSVGKLPHTLDQITEDWEKLCRNL